MQPKPTTITFTYTFILPQHMYVKLPSLNQPIEFLVLTQLQLHTNTMKLARLKSGYSTNSTVMATYVSF
jgi:hypothetical protein